MLYLRYGELSAIRLLLLNHLVLYFIYLIMCMKKYVQESHIDYYMTRKCV